jgi:hypothetical protein
VTSEQRKAQRTFRRVQQFLVAHPISDGPASLGKQVKELDAVVAEFAAEAESQEAGRRQTQGGTQRQRALREALWDGHMLPIAQIARDVFGVPGMDKDLRMPKKSGDNEALIAAAGAMAEAAARESKVFVEHGLPADFVEQLKAATSALDQAIDARGESARRLTIATASNKELVKRGKRAVRLLNAILRPRLAKDPELLQGWDNVRRDKDVPGGAGVAVEESPSLLDVA